MSEAITFTARLDTGDRLIVADDGFAALNEPAGGAVGEHLAVPQLATVVRLARRLRIMVQRAVTIADGDHDLECWVRATPDAAGVTLCVSPLRERPPWRAVTSPGVADVPPPAGADWRWAVDAELRVTHLPVEMGVGLGFDAIAALGHPLTDILLLEGPGEPGRGGTPPLLAAREAMRDFDGQAAIVRASGRRVMLAGTARHGPSGAFAGFIGGAFADMAGAAGEAAGLSRAFSGQLDRILRQPLGRIIANADSIHAASDGPLDPHYVDYAADIAGAARHLMGLVDDLADIEAIERDDFTIPTEPLDLADVARRAAGLFAVRAADAGVTLDVAGIVPSLTVAGDFRRTLQIMVNLIGNALRYSPRGATVWLLVQRDGDRAVAIVADRGKGIPVDEQQRIFEKFTRLDPAEPGGSGLGLYIARRLARAMGGDLTVDSAPGAGARFVLALPIARQETLRADS